MDCVVLLRGVLCRGMVCHAALCCAKPRVTGRSSDVVPRWCCGWMLGRLIDCNSLTQIHSITLLTTPQPQRDLNHGYTTCPSLSPSTTSSKKSNTLSPTTTWPAASPRTAGPSPIPICGWRTTFATLRRRWTPWDMHSKGPKSWSRLIQLGWTRTHNSLGIFSSMNSTSSSGRGCYKGRERGRGVQTRGREGGGRMVKDTV